MTNGLTEFFFGRHVLDTQRSISKNCPGIGHVTLDRRGTPVEIAEIYTSGSRLKFDPIKE